MRPTPKPSFLLLEVGLAALPGLLLQMVETRGNRPSFDGTSELDSFSVDVGDLGKLFSLCFLVRCAGSCHLVFDRRVHLP